MQGIYVEFSSWLFTCVETRGNPLWGFPEISNARKRGVIIGLTVSRCGNSWKPPVKFPKVSNARNRGGILGLTVSRCGNLVETTLGFPPSFQFRESRWNPRVDCFQVWKPSGNHIGVSPKWKLRGNYWCHDSLWFPAGFHFWETAFFTQWFGWIFVC